MSDDGKLLSQEEIDALLSMPEDAEDSSPDQPALTPDEQDALGEIGNISMGSASTTLSTLLNQRVTITSPRVSVMTEEELWSTFEFPFVTIEVEFKEGLQGQNILIMNVQDALVVADLMMGGEGAPQNNELTELELSAASEAMNQMIGTAATSLASMFDFTVNIAPPVTNVLKENEIPPSVIGEGALVIVSFRMTIGEIVDTEIMQILSMDIAKAEARLLLGDIVSGESEKSTTPEEQKADLPEPKAEKPVEPREEPAAAPALQKSRPEEKRAVGDGFAQGETQPPLPDVDWEKLNLIMDIPLKVTVLLGKTKKPIKEVLRFNPGSIVELSSLAEEPVDILVNGTLVAKGEVVVVNENFGVRITDIVSTKERIKNIVK